MSPLRRYAAFNVLYVLTKQQGKTQITKWKNSTKDILIFAEKEIQIPISVKGTLNVLHLGTRKITQGHFHVAEH